ncbi:MAG TPA: hypothetical protein VGB07_06600, partial [Blastocatellia bacterium]
NISTGQDDNRDTIINDRPAGINRNSNLAASLYGSLTDRCLSNCQAGQAPVMLLDFLRTNFPDGVEAVGPGALYANLSVSKNFGIGKRGGTAQSVSSNQKNAGQKNAKQSESPLFNVQLVAQMTNVLNRVNFGQYSGVLTSPFFGRSNSANAARRIEFSVRFGF